MDNEQSRSYSSKEHFRTFEPLANGMFLRNEGSIHRPRGLSVLYCPFSDGTPSRAKAFADEVWPVDVGKTLSEP
jgi:hypothetical protein